MKELTVCVQSIDLKCRLRAAAMLMQASLHEISMEKLLALRKLPGHWILVEASLEELSMLINRFKQEGKDPSGHIIRFIDKPWQSYFYHDIPIFASIVMPADPLSAVQVLERIMKAKPLSFDGPVVEEPESVSPFSSEFVQSRPMTDAVEQLMRLRNLPVDTVLLGPTGAGKDTTARWLHDQSKATGEFVHINCAALPEQLFEAELFGVTAGAFTGAQKDRAGKLELANNGTLYLDEIDSLPLTCQAKLLTALQYRGAIRLGGSQFYSSNFRVIASTKVDFAELVQKGVFRQDLYFRLNVSQVIIPSLSQRLEDIVPLYTHFLKLAASKFNLPVPALSDEAVDVLLSHPWPGNIRELHAQAQRHVLGLQQPETLLNLGKEVASSWGLKHRVLAFERAVIDYTLRQSGGCAKTAASILGIPLHSLYYRLKKLDNGLDVLENQVESQPKVSN